MTAAPRAPPARRGVRYFVFVLALLAGLGGVAHTLLAACQQNGVRQPRTASPLRSLERGGSASGTFPSLAVYTVNHVKFGDEKDEEFEEERPAALSGLPTISAGLWWAEFLLVSRLHNPSLPITALVNQQQRVAGSSVGAALADAGIQLASIEALSAPGSRGATLQAASTSFFTTYLRLFAPGHLCADGATMATPRCQKPMQARSRWLARFCWQSDLANQQGVEYVLTLDADAMLTDDLVGALFEPYMRRGADVLTFTEWSSQVVLWRREALNAFCDAQVELLGMDTQAQFYVFQAGRGGTVDQEWTDMHFLQAFLRVMRPDLSRTILCGTPSDDAQELCRSLVWKVAQAASYLPARSDSDHERRDQSCQRLDEFVEWRRGDEGSTGNSSSSSRRAGRGGGSAGGADSSGSGGNSSSGSGTSGDAGGARGSSGGAGSSDGSRGSSSGGAAARQSGSSSRRAMRDSGSSSVASGSGSGTSGISSRRDGSSSSSSRDISSTSSSGIRSSGGSKRGSSGSGGTASGGTAASEVLPQAWTRWQWYDLPQVMFKAEQRAGLKERKHGPPQRVPLIHWQGGCKDTGSRYVWRYYVEPGLLPCLGGCGRGQRAGGGGAEDAEGAAGGAA